MIPYVDVYIRVRVKTDSIHKACELIEETMPPCLYWLPSRVVTNSLKTFEKLDARKRNTEFRRLIKAQDEQKQLEERTH